jgi:hypothetical protein
VTHQLPARRSGRKRQGFPHRYTPNAISKQLSVLLRNGILRNPRGCLNEIVPHFIANKANRILEFGYCVIRLNVGT